MAGKTKDGLPRSSYAYAPTDNPADWKLKFLTASGEPDPDTLPGAAAAVGPKGYRGQKVDVPASALPAIKAKLRQAYRRMGKKPEEFPDGIREAGLREVGLAEGPIGPYPPERCYNCNHPVQCNCTDCSCAMHVSESLGDVYRALDALGDLYALLDSEAGEPAHAALVQAAINPLLKFVPAEGAELVVPEGAMAEALAESVALLAEAGRRNASRDQKALDMAHDALHDVGARHSPGRKYPGMPVSESTIVEADAGTTPEAVTIHESGISDVPVEAWVVANFREAGADFDDATKSVWITPIRPGFGNPRDGFYYPTETLRTATEAGVFVGRKMYADHPTTEDEKKRPERSVKDWVATVKETVWDEQRQRPRARLQAVDDGFYGKAKADPESIAFSILGKGTARPGKVGDRPAKVVESLDRVRSVDWVTEAGAGGAIDFAESDAEETEMPDINLKDLTADQIRDGNPDLYAALTGGKVVVDDKPAAAAKPAEGTDKPADKPADAPAAPDAAALMARLAAVEGQLATRTAAEAREANRQETRPYVAGLVAESTLPRHGKERVLARFAEATAGDGMAFASRDALKAAVEAEVATTKAFIDEIRTGRPKPIVEGGGAPPVEGEVRESSAVTTIRERMVSRWGDDTPPSAGAFVFEGGQAVMSEAKRVGADESGQGKPSRDDVAARMLAKS